MTVERDIDIIEVKPVGAIEFRRNPNANLRPGGLVVGTEEPGPDGGPDEEPEDEDPGGHAAGPAL